MWREVKAVSLSLGLLAAGAAGGFQLAAQAPAPAQMPAAAARDEAAMRAAYDRWRTEFKTWGKWGADDNKGASNLITPQTVLRAVKLVKTGTVVSLAANVAQQPAQDAAPASIFRRTTNSITEGGTTDTYAVSYHGQVMSHMDTWCHFLENGRM